MPSYDRHKPNSISWIDLATSDLDGAVAFYSDLMGWTTFNDGETPYHIFMNGEAAVGGVMALAPEMGEMPPVWSVYVGIEDIDATVAATKKLGGSVMQEPFDVPDGGKIAVIMDPAEGALCLFEGGLENGLGQIDEVGAPCWFETRSRDTVAVREFYSSLFGWTAVLMEELAPFEYHTLNNGDDVVAGVMDMTEMFPPEVPAHWGITFSVADADEAMNKTVAAGGMAPMGPMDTPFGRSVQLMDPWGAAFMVIDRSSAAAG